MSTMIPLDSFAIGSDKLDEYREKLVKIVKEKYKYSTNDWADAYDRYAIALFYHGSYRESLSHFICALAIRSNFKIKTRSDAFTANLVSKRIK